MNGKTALAAFCVLALLVSLASSVQAPVSAEEPSENRTRCKECRDCYEIRLSYDEQNRLVCHDLRSGFFIPTPSTPRSQFRIEMVYQGGKLEEYRCNIPRKGEAVEPFPIYVPYSPSLGSVQVIKIYDSNDIEFLEIPFKNGMPMCGKEEAAGAAEKPKEETAPTSTAPRAESAPADNETVKEGLKEEKSDQEETPPTGDGHKEGNGKGKGIAGAIWSILKRFWLFIVVGLVAVALGAVAVLLPSRKAARRLPPPPPPPPSKPRARLLLPGNLHIPLAEGTRVVGRADLARVLPVSALKCVSRQHFAIGVINGQYYIEDLGSVNGTRLNGAEIKGAGKMKVVDGDEVNVAGVVSLTFRAL